MYPPTMMDLYSDHLYHHLSDVSADPRYPLFWSKAHQIQMYIETTMRTGFSQYDLFYFLDSFTCNYPLVN